MAKNIKADKIKCSTPEAVAKEAQISLLVERVSVKPESISVTRPKLHEMKLDTNEPITGQF